ncbi:unnamed protein product [Dicrocoelium dendriticum]|nr:unnamed protein product [Dicrocoelium dendriticum]
MRNVNLIDSAGIVKLSGVEQNIRRFVTISQTSHTACILCAITGRGGTTTTNIRMRPAIVLAVSKLSPLTHAG